MAFIIEVNGDTSDVTPKLNDLGKSLDAVEQKGKTAGAGITQGMREGSASADKLKGGLAGLDAAIAAIDRTNRQFEDSLMGGANAMKAEQDMLDRINGPLNKYMADMLTLDQLLGKNAISTEQYAEQVIKLNTALEKQQTIKSTDVKYGPDASMAGEKAGPQFGPDRNQAGPSGAGSGEGGDGGGLLGGTAAMIAGLATIATVKKLGTELIDLSDRYIELSNQALRLTDASHDVNSVLFDQMGISEKLHGSMAQTIALTAAVRAGSEAMNLTSLEQKQLVTDIAEKVQLAGHSMDDAVGVAKRLQYAFEEGIVPGRQLKGIFEEYPNVSKTMQAELGVNEARLTSLGKQGKITGEMLRDGFSISAEEQKQFDARMETTGEKADHLKDQISMGAHGLGDWMVSLASTEGTLSHWGQSILGVRDEVKSMQDQIADEQMKRALDDFFQDGIDQANKLTNAVSHITPGVQAIFDAYDHKDDNIKNIAGAIQVNQDMQEKLNASNLTGAQREAEMAPLMAQHTKFVRDLEAATRSHVGVLKQHHTAMTELQKVYESINKPMREHEEGLAAVANVTASVQKQFAAGQMSAEHYAVAMSELAKAHEHYWEIIGEKGTGSNSSVADASGSLITKMGGDKLQQTGSGLNLDAIEPQDTSAKDALGLERMKQADALYATLRSSAEKYTDEVKKIGDSDLSLDLQNKLLDNLKQKYFDVLDPEKKHIDGLAQLVEMGKAAGLSVTQLADVEDDYRKKTGMARDATLGFKDGLAQIQKEMGTGGATAAAKLMTDSFNGVNSALTELITTGTTDWTKFVKSLETDAVSFSLKSLEGSLFSSLKGIGSSAASISGVTGAATSTSAMGTAAAAATAPIDTLAASIASLGAAAQAASASAASIPGIGIAGGAAPTADAVSGVDAGGVVSDGTLATLGYHVPGGGGGGASARQAPVNVSVVNQSDPRQITDALGTPRGQRAVAQQVIKNPRLFKSLLGRR